MIEIGLVMTILETLWTFGQFLLTYWREILIPFLTIILLLKSVPYIVGRVLAPLGLRNAVCQNQRNSSYQCNSLPVLPQFWPTDPVGYFGTIKTLFTASNVFNESQRYSMLLNELTKSPDLLKRIYDILPRKVTKLRIRY